MSQEELESLCPELTKEIDNFLVSNPKFEDAEATIYALTQLLHDRLQVLEMSLEEKGAIVATVIDGLVAFNQEALAVHNDMLKTIREQKASTVH